MEEKEKMKSFKQYIDEGWRDWLPKIHNPFKRNSPEGSYRDKANKAVTNQRAQWTKRQGKLPPISGEIKAKSGAPSQTAKAVGPPSTEIRAKSGAPTQTAKAAGSPPLLKPRPSTTLKNKRGGAANNVDLTKDVPKVATGKGQVTTAKPSKPLYNNLKDVKPRPIKPTGPPDKLTAAPNASVGTAKQPDSKPLVGLSTAKAETPPPSSLPAQPNIINKGAADTKTKAAPTQKAAPAPAKKPAIATAAGPSNALARPRAPVARPAPKRSFGYGRSGAGHAPTRTASKGMNAGQITNRALGGVFEEKESFESFVRNKFLKENNE